MSATCLVFVIACMVAAICSVVLILSPLYRDGVFGKVALIAVFAGTATVVVHWLAGWDYSVQPTTLTTHLGVAGLLVWRVTRLWREGG